jgi:DNA primase catalytic core
MARIPEQELERLKREVAVERLAEARGVVLARKGADLVGLCPFHEDHEPSLVITPAKNLWHCLGACQAGGSVIDWAMRAEGVSFRHAVELLQADYQPSSSSAALGAVKRSTVTKLRAPLERGADDARLLAQVIAYYHETLLQSPEALAYLERRGIASAEAISRFQLGFANRTLGYRLPAKTRLEGAAMRGQLQRIGILRPSGHEHFNGSLVIPVLGEAGCVTEVYGRKITDALREGTPLHLYLPGPHQGVWNARALQASKEIILCESLIDALTFWCAGYRNVTASYGVEGFTQDHLAAFLRHGTERVLIAYDRDAAGEAAAEKLAPKLLAAGIDCYRIQFPKGMDANEYALKVKPATKSLGVLIRAALWLGKGKAKPVTTEASAVEPTPATLAAPAPTPMSSADTEEGLELAAEPALPLAAEEAAKEEAAASRIEATPFEAPLLASALPAAPAAELPAAVSDHEIALVLGDRRYRIRGLAKNPSYETLKVNLLVSRPAFGGVGEALHVDSFDLYAQRPRTAFAKQAAAELGVQEDVIKADLGKILLRLEALQDEAIARAQAPREPASPQISEAERAEALALLRDPHLLARVEQDLEACGLVGERSNKELAYLAATSRKLAHPLAVVVRSSSAAGKSSLMEAVLALVPPEERVQYSAMTGQSLFYMGEMQLAHKVLAIAEEEGAARARYALKLLQSEGELTIASTGKDPKTGNLVTQEYRVEGPVMIFLTTTACALDDELLNRCLVLSVDEGRAQTRAIHARQRDQRTLAGLVAKAEREAIRHLHQNAQRLLRPLAVHNPYVQALTFPDAATRLRRDHEKYLTLIDTIALLHQHQREVKVREERGLRLEYIEVELSDIARANALAHEVLGRSLDELPPQTRRLLHEIEGFVAEQSQALAQRRADFRFRRRQLRAALCTGDTQLKIHLARLVELEYVIAHRAERGTGFVYELAYDGQGADGQPFVPGLIDARQLEARAYDAERSGPGAGRSGPGRHPVGAGSGGGRSEATLESEGAARACVAGAEIPAQTHVSGSLDSAASYPQRAHA